VSRDLDELLRELGPSLQRGERPAEPLVRFATGLPEIDRLLGGGFPRRRLSEITGARSSGRTSLALALLAHTTGAGEVCAVVDAADGFDPISAQAAGVVLERVLWARAPGLREALRSAERLLEAEGFGLVLLQLAGGDSRTAPAITGTPPLLEGLEVEARLARHRTAPADRSVRVRLRTSQAA
jgi:RecA/RadA recombinase